MKVSESLAGASSGPVPNTDQNRAYVPRSDAGQRGCEGGSEHTEHTEPTPPTSGEPGHVLDEVRQTIQKYCVLPSEDALVAVTLWTAATHLVDEFDHAPRLVVRSPEKRSGKSRLTVDVIGAMVSNPLLTVNASTPYIFRQLDGDVLPTLIIDEADTIFGTKIKAEQNEDLRGLLNAGFQRGLSFGRTVGPTHTPTDFPTFAMAALAGIKRLPDTIEDRAVVVPMQRRTAGESVAKYRNRRDGPLLAQVRDRLGDWAEQIREQIRDHIPEDLGVDDRPADVWEPLVAVADMAGGEWPEAARLAARRMTSEAAVEDQDDSDSLQLLRDIRSVLVVDKIKSVDLCRLLRDLEESPWDEERLSPPTLGRKLSPFGLKTRQEPTGKRHRYFHREDFEKVFARYIPPTP